MKKLWIAFIVVATYGSIYPFDFQATELDVTTLRAFARSCCNMPSRGDILGNVILFVPFGFTGMFAVRRESSALRRFVFVFVTGAIFAFILQVIQIYLPSRHENLQDVAWNLLGTAGGAAMAGLLERYSPASKAGAANISLVPLTLVGTWLIYRLIPFIPALDFQLIKDSLKPLLNAQLMPVNIIHDFTAWIVVAYLLRCSQRSVRLDTYLPVLMIAVFCLEVLIVDNSVNASNVVGATLAIFLWWGLLRHVRWQKGALVMSLLLTLALRGLAPFAIRLDPVAFNWLPFYGFLGESMYLNAQSAAEKVFLYGSLVYLLWRTGISSVGGIMFGSSFVMIIELAQTRLIGHTPEITDPLLVILAALTLMAVERREIISVSGKRIDTFSRQGLSAAATGSNLRSANRKEKWRYQTINLRAHQFDFLVRLSQETGISVSRATRRIVAQFIKEAGRETILASGVRVDQSAVIGSLRATLNDQPGEHAEKWVRQTINLRAHQFNFLMRLSRAMKISVSGVTRRIIAQFMEGLGKEDDEMNRDYLT